MYKQNRHTHTCTKTRICVFDLFANLSVACVSQQIKIKLNQFYLIDTHSVTDRFARQPNNKRETKQK